MGNKSKISILIAVLLVLAGGLFYFLLQDTQEPAQNGQNGADGDSITENWRRFEAPEFGFSFAYPPEWGEAEFNERAGGQGGTKAMIQFSNINWFSIGGISEDFAEGRGGIPTDTQGFEKEGDNYFFKFVSTNTIPIEPVKIVDTELGEAVIADHRSFVGDEEPVGPVMTVGSGNLGALVNLDGNTYSGVIFLNNNMEEFGQDMFEDMLRTLQPNVNEEAEMTVQLYYYNPALDQGPGGAQCTRAGLVAVERTIPRTITPLRASVELLMQGELTPQEEAQGITTEFPLSGTTLESASIEDGVATLTFNDPESSTSGGACRTGILWGQIEETAKQFPTVDSARFMPEELFQP